MTDEPGEETFATYEEAAIAARLADEAFAAALPARMQEIADQLSGSLPGGVRFEWQIQTGITDECGLIAGFPDLGLLRERPRESRAPDGER